MAKAQDEYSIVLFAGNHPLSEADLITLLRDPTTMSFWIVDASGSMSRHGSAPQDAINFHFEQLKNPPDGSRQLGCVLSFAYVPKIEVPLIDAQRYVPMNTYSARGETLLYRTVDECLQSVLNLFHRVPQHLRHNLKIAVGVLSDGEDTISNVGLHEPIFPEKVQATSRAALAAGFELHAYGLGINGVELARKLGFPTDDAHVRTLEATRASIHSATCHFSHSTTTLHSVPIREVQEALRQSQRPGQPASPDSQGGPIQQSGAVVFFDEPLDVQKMPTEKIPQH